MILKKKDFTYSRFVWITAKTKQTRRDVVGGEDKSADTNRHVKLFLLNHPRTEVCEWDLIGTILKNTITLMFLVKLLIN